MQESVLPSYIDIADMKNEADVQRATFSNAANAFDDNAILRMAQRLEGSAVTLQSYKTAMGNATKWFTDQNTFLKNILTDGSVASADYWSVYRKRKEVVDELRKKVEQERELEGIRQEQVTVLEGRDAANYHSSWMGLQRPMKSSSHTGLLVAAIMFLLFAIFTIFYIYRMRIPDSFRGGFRKGIQRKG